MAEYTPMMEQYLATKKEYKDCILFYRLGDFYEMFFEDAVVASKELELTLTGKNCGVEERAPMCGVPFHAVEPYLNKLVQRGYKVAICEQVEDPKLAKGIVKREVVRIVTPGTNIDSMALEESAYNYIVSVCGLDNSFGFCACDVSTGDIYGTQIEDKRRLLDELLRYKPSEIIYDEAALMRGFDINAYQNLRGCVSNVLGDEFFGEKAAMNSLGKHPKLSVNADFLNYGAVKLAAGALLGYLFETQKSNLDQIKHIKLYASDSFMLIDAATRRNLELTETMRDKRKVGSLLGVLDKTKTAMGARVLRGFVEQPLTSIEEISRRADAVEELKANMVNRAELREYLSQVYDLERLMTRISYQTANPRDLIAFKESIKIMPAIKTILSDYDTALIRELNFDIDDLRDLYTLLENSIVEEPPISVRDGGIIKESYNEEIARLRQAKTKGKTWLAELEASEREKTGIKNLRIKYNKVFGYYLEVTNSYKELVPDYFIRKQTLANAERYYTDRLKELEDDILGSEDRLNNIEYEFFKEVRDTIGESVARIQTTARAVANLDAFLSLAQVAEANNYIRPAINNRGIIDIKEGRHPVVEKGLGEKGFITNDTYLDLDDNNISIITGPNMAGKSTYMRQVALITLMAQIGSFVPASSATICICDRIFTRVGASDDLSTGQSTFMVEMNEVANILRNATKRSLLILDEIGRGTSTYDGLSIAWAVVEHIAGENGLGAKTLFATHYHELTELEGRLKGVNNYCIAVTKQNDDVIFLRKIIKGAADQSYGIEVAKLAGLPEAVIERAKELVITLNQNDINKKTVSNIKPAVNSEEKEKSFKDDIVELLLNTDVMTITPIEAMNVLAKLKDMTKHE